MIYKGVMIGVDIGGSNIRAAIVEEDTIKEVKSVPVDRGGSEFDVINQVIQVIKAVKTDAVEGVGIGVPGVVDVRNGIAYDVQNIPAWKEVPLKRILENKFSLPVLVNNDANCFVLGEKYYGKARGYSNVVGLIIGTGMGAGLVLNGRLYEGTNCGAGEVGMFPYKDSVLEHYSAGLFFERVYGTTGDDVFRRAQAGDTQALAIFREFGTHIGHAIRNILYAYDPEVIVLGGSGRNAFPFFKETMWNSLSDFPYQRILEGIKVEVSTREHISILGAAALILNSRYW